VTPGAVGCSAWLGVADIFDCVLITVVLLAVSLVGLSCPWPVPPTWEQEAAKMQRGWRMLRVAVALILIGFGMMLWKWNATRHEGTSERKSREPKMLLQCPPMTASRRNERAAALLTQIARKGRARPQVCRKARLDQRAYEARPDPKASCETDRGNLGKPVRWESLSA